MNTYKLIAREQAFNTSKKDAKKDVDFYNIISLKDKWSYHLRFLLEHFLGFSLLQPLWNKWSSNTQKNIYESVRFEARKKLNVKEFSADIDPEIIRREYLKKGIPVVIRKGAESWTAFKKWDFSFFKDNYGDHPVLLTHHKDLGDEKGEGFETNLKKIIDGIGENSMNYARFNPLLDTYPELQEDLNQNWLDKVRDTKIKKHHVLFIGNKGTKTNIHNAGNENIFVQIKGKKRWLLWDQKAHYVFNPEVNRGPAKASPLDPNLSEHPKNRAYDHLPYYELILEPGDIILIPAYLWHYVENLTPTIGIGNRWLSPINTIKNNPLFAILELFNTSPSIFTTLDWRKGFDFNKIMIQNQKK